MNSGPLALYRAKLAQGELKPDPAQGLAAEKLQSLHLALASYRPAQGQSGWRERFGLARREAENPPQGLYIYGPVGRGKSMLMDLFFQSATIAGKKRVHFHEFMRDIHKDLHAWRQVANRTEADPLPKLARKIAAEAWLLCFDELQVQDIADAMILGRLFQLLLDNGVTIVATSNRPPDDLYKDGLQREKFLPFIALLKQRLDVLELSSQQDYRLNRLAGMKVFHHPLGPAAAAEMESSFLRLSDGEKGAPEWITVQGRRVEVPRAAQGAAFFTFEELCARPLGAADYLALATHYHTLFLEGIPRLGPEQRNEAKRFCHLVDALYEHKTVLICSADGTADSLYPKGDGSFEFERTASRLMEMQSKDYLEGRHLT